MKFRRMYIASLGFVLVAHIQASPVKEHNEPHAGIQEAINRLDAQGCTRYQITRSGQYTLNDSTDATSYTLTGNTITIKCTRYTQPEAPTVVIHDLKWTRPTTRTDGTALAESEIKGYTLEVDGIATFIGNVLSYSAKYADRLTHNYRIATVDTFGQQGPWSNELRLQDGN